MPNIRYALSIAAILVCYGGWAQLSKKEARLKEDADVLFAMQDYAGALPFYRELLALYPDDPALNTAVGISMFHLRSTHQKALPYLKKAVDAKHVLAYYHFASLLHEQGRLDTAEYLLVQLLSMPDTLFSVPKKQAVRRLGQVRTAQEMMARPVAVTVEKLGPAINSDYAEHTPLISWDDSLLFFTSRRPLGIESEVNAEGEFLEDIYMSRRGADGKWLPAEPVSSLNTKYNDAMAGLSFDTRELIFFRTNKRVLSTGDLHRAVMKDGIYEDAGKMKKPVNSPAIEAGATFASDGHFIIFSSNRPGGYGGMDLWRVVRIGDGIYSKAQNLGPDINTEADEIGAFLLPDNRSLYFSSNRSESMGGFDVFRCKMLSDTAFTAPENIGYPLNSLGNDVFFSLTPNGTKGYFSRAMAGNPADLDIFTTTVPGMNVKANIIKGRIINVQTGEPVRTEIKVYDEKSQSLLGIYNSSEGNGKYLIVLLPTEDAVMEINEPGYQTYRRHLEYVPGEDIVEISANIELAPEE